ncbi:MAG: DMT family transporter [Anaerolineales bacterium]|nr:DMT family transporter [Anaerolineales bacterium]
MAATVLWSSTGVFIRYLTETYRLPPLVLAFWRDLFLAVAMSLALKLLKPGLLRLERRHWRFMLLYGLVVSVFNSLWTISVALNGAAVSTVLAYSSAAFTAVLGWRLLSESLGPVKILAVSLSLLGCVAVSGAYDQAAWQVNTLGIVTGILSGMAFAVYSLMGRTSAQRSISAWTALLYAFGMAVPFLLLYNIFSAWLPQGVASMELFWLGSSWSGWLILLILAVGPTVGGFGLYTVSLAHLPASVANIIATLEPAMTAGLAYLFLGEFFTVPQWIGSALIVAGVIVLRLSERR